MTSDAGGRTPSRTVRITYPHYGPPSPEHERGTGTVLTVFTVTAGTFLGFGMLLMALTLPDSLLETIICLVLALGLLGYWWYISVGTIVKATINRRRRHRVRGVVVDRVDQWWRQEEGYDHELWYLAVDDGTRDQVIGWEVPAETYARFELGAEVEAEVSGDGRYLYSINPR